MSNRSARLKVRQNTPDLLRISGFPVMAALALLGVISVPVVMSVGLLHAGQVAGGLVTGAIALLLLFGCFGVFVRHRTIILDRTDQTVRVIERGVLGVKRTTRSIRGLEGASVQTRVIPQTSSSGRDPPDVRIFRPVLVFGGGSREPMYEVFTDGRDASVIATAVNGWVGGYGAPDLAGQPKAAAGS